MREEAKSVTETEKSALRGREVLPALAAVYPQLYLVPGPEGARVYPDIVRSGQDAPSHALNHFLGHEDDSLLWEETPAGPVPVITLQERADFELFLQIMAHRCEPTPIPRTQGASILDGVVNWTKIRAHREEFLRAGGGEAAWPEEFTRFTADRANYKDALIVLSAGPYSAVPAEELGLSESEWLAASHTIRKAHECTHFLCRRLFPEKKDAIWDELVADAAGLYAAFGSFDRALAERFLGVSDGAYRGGRLENYVDGEENKRERLDCLAQKIDRTLRRFESILADRAPDGPYELAIRLEEEIGCWKQP